MRVIGGVARGRMLRTVRGRAVRPTPDRVREALFNILAARVPGSSVLDLFAGSGAVGIEALSRGAPHVVFVDQNHAHLRVVGENLSAVGLAAGARLICRDADVAIAVLAAAGEEFDVIFMDPPYGHGLVDATLLALARHPLLAAGGVIVAEHHQQDPVLPEFPAGHGRRLLQTARYRYGDVHLSLFGWGGQAAHSSAEEPEAVAHRSQGGRTIG